MKKWLALSWALLVTGFVCVAQAQLPLTHGGKGAPVATSYVGPGDVVSGASAWWSCARAYNAAYANGSNSLCDLVAVTGGASVCTLRVATTGFADLAGTYCAGTDPAAACAAASGGSCKVSKAYDQTGNARDATQATLANMPAITFADLNSLPTLTFSSGSSTNLTAASFTATQPFSFSAVYIRTVNAAGGILATATAGVQLRGAGVANSTTLACTTAVANTANDSAWHAGNVVCNGTSSAARIDSTDNTGLSAGTTNISADTMRMGNSSGGVFLTGRIAEGGFWPSTGFDATQRSNVNTNQHGTNGYNF